MSEQAHAFLTQANQAIQDGRFEEALTQANQAILLDASLGEAYMARGIAQAQLGQADSATQSFREAISFSPTNAKPYYNLAAHQYRIGERTEALAMVRESLRLDPTNAAALDLIRLIDSESGAIPPSSPNAQPGYGSPYGSATESPYVRAGYGAPVGALPFIDRLGTTWIVIGWVLSTLSLVILATSVLMMLPMITQIMANPANQAAISADWTAKAGVGYTLVNIGSWVAWLLMVVWGVLDIVHRRGNWLWLLGFVCCFHFIIGPLYILLGRKP